MALDIRDDLRHRALTATPMYCVQKQNHFYLICKHHPVSFISPKGITRSSSVHISSSILRSVLNTDHPPVAEGLHHFCTCFRGQSMEVTQLYEKKNPAATSLTVNQKPSFSLPQYIYNFYTAPPKISKESLGSLLAIPHYT